MYTNSDTTDYFLRTNPFVLPVIKRGTNRVLINGSSMSYIELPLKNFVIGIKPISQEVPQEYRLYQNYPNPFNPVTNIKFSIPEQGVVTLKVFDITGREIALLVNQHLSAGTYNYDYNASNLASGVYFYRIVVDSYGEVTGEKSNQLFTETKKMILLR